MDKFQQEFLRRTMSDRERILKKMRKYLDRFLPRELYGETKVGKKAWAKYVWGKSVTVNTKT